jgi:hypothetical protein
MTQKFLQELYPMTPVWKSEERVGKQMEGKDEEGGRNENPHWQNLATPLCPHPFPSSAPRRRNPGYEPGKIARTTNAHLHK